MNKAFYLIITLVITGLVAAISLDGWRSHDFVRANGHEGTLRIGQRYNASRWAEPLPLKKIHAYTATLAPNHEVIIESDQDFNAGQQVFIRYLDRGANYTPLGNIKLRPASGSIRLRTEADGTPLKIDPTAPMEHVLDLAMGSSPNPTTSSRPDGSVATNPELRPTAFLVGGANDSVLELIWNNSRAGEWALLFFALFLLQAFAINAWTLPWREAKHSDEDKDFIHPSLEQVEPDAPRAPVTKIAFKPKPKAPDSEASDKTEPANDTDRVLRLPRK
jgi:hypothetical protein